jgi:cytochrome b561
MFGARYPAGVRLAHWATAALVLSLLGLGLAMVDSLATWRIAGLAMHKIAGLTVLLLTMLRIGLRSRHRAAPLPDTVGRSQRAAAAATHLLYCLLVAVPLTGWAMQGAAGIPILLPGGLVLPPIAGQDLVAYGVLRQAHGVLTLTLLATILLHVGGALHHGVVKRDGVLRRML